MTVETTQPSEGSFLDRTRAFFGQDFEILEQQMKGREIILLGTNKRVQVMDAKGWTRDENEKGYRDVLPLVPGEVLFINRHAGRLFLIAAMDRDETGACLQLRKGRYFDQATGNYVPFKAQRDICEYFGLPTTDTHSPVGDLRFLDNTPNLYLVPRAQEA